MQALKSVNCVEHMRPGGWAGVLVRLAKMKLSHPKKRYAHCLERASRRKVLRPAKLRTKPCEVVVGFIPFLIVGVIAGWIASRIMRGGGYGLIGNLGLGIVGAIVGGNVLKWLGIYTTGGMAASIISASLGAIILLWVLGLLRGES
jgi:uncharacterized membrane protein YeaQ/YmgE (transglycosylase-associated protein family)